MKNRMMLFLALVVGVLVFGITFEIQSRKADREYADAERRGEFMCIAPAYFVEAAERSIACGICVPVGAALFARIRSRHNYGPHRTAR